MPGIQDANRNEVFNKEIYRELGSLGLLGPHLHENGCSGVNNVIWINSKRD